MMLLLLACLLLGYDEPRVRPEPLGTFDAKRIPEASGVVRSRTRPDVFWVHNDSGNPPKLFAVGRDGRILHGFDLAVPNIDWEDAAVDERGRIYIGDIGDNKGLLRLRAVYRFDEPDPDHPPSGPLKPTAAAFYARPGEDCFDAEGFVVDGGRAVIVTKRFDGRDAELRSVPLDPPPPLLRPAAAERIGSLPDFKEPVTGADLSPDGRLLVACGVDVVRIYQRPSPPSWEGLAAIAEVRLKGGSQFEGVAWDGGDLILVAEGDGVARLSESTWRAYPPRVKKTKKKDR